MHKLMHWIRCAFARAWYRRRPLAGDYQVIADSDGLLYIQPRARADGLLYIQPRARAPRDRTVLYFGRAAADPDRLPGLEADPIKRSAMIRGAPVMGEDPL